MTRLTPDVLIFLSLVFIVFITMWIGVSFIVSRFGWHAFALRYPCPARPTGQSYTATFARFGYQFISYHRIIKAIFTSSGVYCYAGFWFRLGHQPFLVPWSSVVNVERKNGIFSHYYQLIIQDAAGKIQLTLPRRIEGELSRYYGIS